MSKLTAIGLFGGTFDPIHFGHLRAALEIAEQLQLDEMRLIPCKNPPHRAMPNTSAIARLNMIRLAVEGTTLSIDDREMHREGPSYTIDTLISLRHEYPKASLCLVLRIDAFLKLPTWHNWEKIIQFSNIIVTYQTGLNIPDAGPIAELLKKHALFAHESVLDFPAGKIVQQNITALEISASMIRSLIQNQRSPQFLLPENVYQYIKQHALYDANLQASV